MNEWINELKVGDEVCAFDRLLVVDRVTPAYVSVGGKLYSKKTGHARGSYTHRDRLRQLTPEMRDALLRRKLLNELRVELAGNERWSVEKLQAVLAAIRSHV